MYNPTKKLWIGMSIFIAIVFWGNTLPKSDKPDVLLEMVDKLNSPLSFDKIDRPEMPQEQQEESTRDFPAFGECDSFCTIDRINQENDLAD